MLFIGENAEPLKSGNDAKMMADGTLHFAQHNAVFNFLLSAKIQISMFYS